MAETERKHERELRAIERKYRAKRRLSRLRRILCAAVIPAVMLLLGILLLLHNRPQRAAVPDDSLCVYVLDVGQGDAILLQCQGHAALIDAGEYLYGDRIVFAMKSLGIEHLDCIINSHPHADHIGGMPKVLRNIPADVMILPEFPAALTPAVPSYAYALEAAEKAGIPLRTAKCHETIALGCAQIELLCTDNSGCTDLNNCSLACRVTCGSCSFLFAGDLETEGEAALLDAGLIRPVSVLKVSHHGSSSSSSEAFLAATSPELAVISVGAPNDYGHPSEVCLSRLIAAGCTVYRTDLNGTVLFSTDGTQITVQTNVKFES